MTHTNVTSFRKNIFGFLRDAIDFNDVISVSTKNGNAIIISEEEYNGMMATLSLSSNPIMEKKIVDGLNTPLEECEELNL